MFLTVSHIAPRFARLFRSHRLGGPRGFQRPRGGFVRIVLMLAALLLPACARADELSLVPFAGWAWGGTQTFDLQTISGDIHVNAAPTYGASLAVYGYDYGTELIYHYQGSDALLRIDGVGEVGRVQVGLHYVLLQLIRQYPTKAWTPFITGGAGAAGLYAGHESDWQFALTLGCGVRKPFANGGSLRLMVRALVPLEFVQNGFSFGAGASGISLSGNHALYQGDVALGYTVPLWRSR